MKRHPFTHCDDKIGVRLLRLREQRDWSQRRVIREIDDQVTAAYLSRIEAGDRQPSMDVILMFAQVFDVDPHWLAWGRHKKMFVAIVDGHAHGLGPFETRKKAELHGRPMEIKRP